VQRIAINGSAGAGKSTLAGRLSTQLRVPYVEMDGLYHGADWIPRAEFVDDVIAFISRDAWVIEYQYDAARPLILERADTIVWLDPPRWLTTWRVTRRTVRRRICRTELWNGNREGPLWRMLIDREHMIRWAWSHYGEAEQRVSRIRHERPDLPIIRLGSVREVERWLAGISGSVF
jgi:adenylate kinase family enzyme